MMVTYLSEIEVPCVEPTELVAKTIIEWMHVKCDISGSKYLLFKSFIDHRKMFLHAVYSGKIEIKCKSTIRKAAASWDICCKWKDRSTSWDKLSNIKGIH